MRSRGLRTRDIDGNWLAKGPVAFVLLALLVVMLMVLSACRSAARPGSVGPTDAQEPLAGARHAAAAGLPPGASCSSPVATGSRAAICCGVSRDGTTTMRRPTCSSRSVSTQCTTRCTSGLRSRRR